MSLFFITGIAGAGKSTVWQELKARGYEAYDADEDGFAKWHNDETGYVHPKSSVKKEDRTEDFLKAHSWKVPRAEVEALAEEAHDRPVFLCGVASNEDEIRSTFRGVFALVIDDDTLKHRLLTRTTNDWGKQPHELQRTLVEQHRASEMYRKSGHIVINASQPVPAVVDEILQAVENLDHIKSR